MVSNASRIRTYRLPPGNPARATRAVSSGIGSGFRACSDIVASNPSDFPRPAGHARRQAADVMPTPDDLTEFATSTTLGEARLRPIRSSPARRHYRAQAGAPSTYGFNAA